MSKYGFKNPIELGWHDRYKISENVSITAVPAIHYSNFTNSTLWAGFIISYADKSGITKKIYFGGDTGYGTFIQREIAKYSPFDLALIGVGAYFLPYKSIASRVHTSPEQAMDIAKEINTKKIIGMHWGTTRMANENPMELFPKMKARAKDVGYEGEITMLRIGETIVL